MDAKLTDGFTAEPLKPEHEPGVLDVLNEANRWMNGGNNFTTLEEMQMEWRSEGFNRDTDALVVLAPDGRAAGYIDVWDVTSMHVRLVSLGYTLPEFMGCGIGKYLLQWSIERARQNLHLAPEGARVVLHQFVNSTNQAAYDLFMNNGFQVARQSYRMKIEFNGPPVPPQIPEGISIRPIEKAEAEKALKANYEAFRDHWGVIDEPFEEYAKRWIYYLENDPNTQPEFWFMALEGDEPAGVALCNSQVNEDPEMGWVWQLSVRRPWRKRGLGQALLQYAFAALHQIGRKRVALGVDATSLTGATRLYERAGMHIWRKSYTYEYELRPGFDMMKQEL